jgi:hypothetical protein
MHSIVQRCCALLDAAARGEDTAAALLQAVVTIQRGCQSRAANGQINREQRRLLNLFSVRAKAGAATHLPIDYDRTALSAGMWAVAYEVAMWGESVGRTALRDPDDVLVFQDSARIFQNELENIVLLGQIAERMRGRNTTLNLPGKSAVCF